MSITSARGSGASGDSPLDRRLCAELGAELARVRAARGLTIAQVSEKLLLSTRQVKALEEVEFAAFHNPTFHVNAMRKYARFAEVDPGRVTAIAAAIPAESISAQVVPVSDAETSDGPGLSLVATLLVVLVLLGGGGYYLWGRQPAASGAPTTAAVSTPEPTPVPVPPPAPVIAEAATTPSTDAVPAATPTATPPEVTAPAATSAMAAPVSAAPVTTTVPPDTMFGVVRVLHPTWVFVRDADNAVTEKSLAQGQTIELETQPTYLAVGTPDVELTIGSRRIDLTRFIANGQVRIRAGDFDALVQGASPIPAPTAAR